MLEALLWAALSGWFARLLLPRESAGMVLTLLCGLGGCLLGYAVGHEILRLHELHLFEPEGLLPAVGGSALLLLASRRSPWSHRRRTIFS